jgi:hypothetical protein
VTAKTAAIVVTSCGKRKSLEPSVSLRAAALSPGDPASVARRWTARLASAPSRIPARELYQGRAFREAELAAGPLAARLYVLSAGLGLIAADHEIPPYSMTVASGADNVLALFEAPGAGPAHWWRELTMAARSHSFAELAQGTSGLLLVAAPATYLEMIAADLETLEGKSQERLRLFTAASSAAVPAFLRPFVMPYDRRLEALPGRSGTLSDFAQRALRHFADEVLDGDPCGTAEAHSAAVLAALAGAEAPQRRRGKSMSDAEIVALICENWERTNGKSAAMLRLFRDSFGVACEQKRFKKLFSIARAERK